MHESSRDPSPRPIDWLHVRPTGKLPTTVPEYPPLELEIAAPHYVRREISRVSLSEECQLSVFPTLGSFQPGYLLVAPTTRALGFFGLTQAIELQRAQAYLEEWRAQLSKLFGDTIIAEHVSAPGADAPAASSAQAHMHLIPLPGLGERLLHRYLEAGGPPDFELKSLAELPAAVKHRSYELLSIQPGTYLIWLNTERFQDQFIRREAADLLGVSEACNWKTYLFTEQMEQTIELLKQLAMFDPIASAESAQDCWRTPYNTKECQFPEDSPHVALHGCTDVERLLFFAACRASGIAEEALDGLTRLHTEEKLSPLELLRAAASARSHLRVHFDTCVSRASFDFLIATAQPPFEVVLNGAHFEPKDFCYESNPNI